MQMLRTVLSWLVLVVIFATLYFKFPNETKTTAHEIFALVSPCTLPIGYRIVDVDPKFGISAQEVRQNLDQAAALWNEAAGKELFKHDEKGTLAVSLVFDSRQEMTERLGELGVELTVDRASYERIKLSYDSAFVAFTSAKASFEGHVSTFNARKAAYEKNVQYWNGRGGAPKEEFEKLNVEQSGIEAMSRTLQEEQSSVNAAARKVNELARALNALIDELKLDVRKYNETGQSHGTSFEQGVYERSLGHESITIFEYENKLLLTRVLAHELGHALGLDHVEDEDAIMYYLNEGENIKLTKADTSELELACKSPLRPDVILQGVQNIRERLSSSAS